MLRNDARIHPETAPHRRPPRAAKDDVCARFRRLLRFARRAARRGKDYRRAHQPDRQKGDETGPAGGRLRLRAGAGIRAGGSGSRHPRRECGSARTGRSGGARETGAGSTGGMPSAPADRHGQPGSGGARPARLLRQGDPQFGKRRREDAARPSARRKKIRSCRRWSDHRRARTAQNGGKAGGDRRKNHPYGGTIRHSAGRHIYRLPHPDGERRTGSGIGDAERHPHHQRKIPRKNDSGRKQHFLRFAQPQNHQYGISDGGIVRGAGFAHSQPQRKRKHAGGRGV